MLFKCFFDYLNVNFQLLFSQFNNTQRDKVVTEPQTVKIVNKSRKRTKIKEKTTYIKEKQQKI